MNNSNPLSNIRTQREIKTVGLMISLYCNRIHNSAKGDLCTECDTLHKYAQQRIVHCPFGYEKPACSQCTVHCYKQTMREKIKGVMRYSGPRMLLRYPYYALMHIVDKLTYKPQVLPSKK